MQRTFFLTLSLICVGTLLGGLVGCGGPFVQGKLNLARCGEFAGQVDSLDVEIERNEDPIAAGRFPVLLAEDGAHATFKINKKSLNEIMTRGQQINELTDKLVVSYLQHIDPMLVVYWLDAEIKARDTVRIAPEESVRFDCNVLGSKYPQYVGNKDIEKIEKHYWQLHYDGQPVPLSGAARKQIDFSIIRTRGTDEFDCGLKKPEDDPPED